MKNKKYKILRSSSVKLNLNMIMKKVCFFSLIHSKHLNHHDWLSLKQSIRPLKLNALVCKNVFFKPEETIFSLPTFFRSSLNHGNFTIFYFDYNSPFCSPTNIFALNNVLKKTHMHMLISSFCARFIALEKLFRLCEVSIVNAFLKLVSLLDFCCCILLSELIKVDKTFLVILGSKQT